MSETTYPALADIIADIWGSEPEASYTHPQLVEKMQEDVANPAKIIREMLHYKMVKIEKEQYRVNDFIRQDLIDSI